MECDAKLICDGECAECCRNYRHRGTRAYCQECAYTKTKTTDYPCCICSNNYTDKFHTKITITETVAADKAKDVRRDILQKAIDVDTDRGATYGDAAKNFENIACMWTDYLHAAGYNTVVLPENVCMMMAIVKMCRSAGGSYHEDNYIDAANYIALAADMSARDGD